MNRSGFAWMLLALCCMGSAARPEGKPNILFIISDDLGCRLGCYGDSAAHTPNLDKLAGQGVLFDRCFTQFPTCGPSRASMLSGLYPFQTGLIHNRQTLDESAMPFVSLPRLFRQQGYFTARAGKVFHMNIPRGIGQPGEDDSSAWDVAINNTGWDAAEENFLSAHYHVSKKPGSAVAYLDPDLPDEEMADGAGTQAILRLMEEHHPRKTGKPMMLFMGYYRPHPPMISPRSHWAAIKASEITLPEFPANDREDIPSINFHLQGPAHNGLPESVGLAYTRAYLAAVSFMDHEVGKLLDGLKKNGLDQNTIIVFTGDQGFHLGEHDHWHKSTFFEEACRVPLIVFDPRTKVAGQTAHGICGLIDLYPTLCELAGVQPQHVLSGISLCSPLKNPALPGKQAEITQGRPGGISIRTERYRYTEWEGGESGSMLYDLHTDPNEFTNRAENPEYADVEKLLKTELQMLTK